MGDNRPELVGTLEDEDYRDLCESLQEDSTSDLEGSNASRSLIMVHPDAVTSFSFRTEPDPRGPRYVPRCSFRVRGRLYRGRPVFDAEWRGYGREVMQEEGGECQVSGQRVFEANGTEDCWLTIGAYEYKGAPYLAVIGVHLFPVRHFEMDWNR